MLGEIAPPQPPRSAAEDLVQMHRLTVHCFAAVPQRVWEKLFNSGLNLSWSAAKMALRDASWPGVDIDDKETTWRQHQILIIDETADSCIVSLRRWGDMLEANAPVGDAVLPWQMRPEGWHRLMRHVWVPFADAIWRQLGEQGEALRASYEARLQLPSAGDLDETLGLALQGLDDPLPWLRWLSVEGQLRAAARGARAMLHRLTGPNADPDMKARATSLLRYLRRSLLLRSVDAGEAARLRVEASGISRALAQTEEDTDEELNDLFQQGWNAAFRANGVDLRQRLEAGLLLGELGDTLRYEWAGAWLHGEEQPRRGLVLKEAHWIHVGQPGGWSHFLICDCESGKAREETLEFFKIAAYPVTMAEWQAFVDGDGYNPEAPWWKQAGEDAQRYVRERNERARNDGWRAGPRALRIPRLSNPVQPVLDVDWYEALAYANWAAPLYDRLHDGLALCVPSDVQWEAGVRGPCEDRRECQAWPHAGGDTDVSEPDALCFNHYRTNLDRSSPVGVFGLGYTKSGVADSAGNVWEWCDNTDGGGFLREEFETRRPATNADKEAKSQRGGGFNDDADDCRIGVRLRRVPTVDSTGAGLRLVLWTPH